MDALLRRAIELSDHRVKNHITMLEARLAERDRQVQAANDLLLAEYATKSKATEVLNTIESERQANALLTEEIARLAKQRDDLQSLLDNAQALIQRTNTRDKELVRQRDELLRIAEGIRVRKEARGFYMPDDAKDLMDELAGVKGEKE